MSFCEKYNRDYAECLKNAVNFLVAWTNTINFYGFLGVNMWT